MKLSLFIRIMACFLLVRIFKEETNVETFIGFLATMKTGIGVYIAIILCSFADCIDNISKGK
jgi:hypothetical protein